MEPGGSVSRIGLSYRPARLHRLAESITLNRILGSIVYKFGLSFPSGGGGAGFVDIKHGMFTFFLLRKVKVYWLLTNNDNSKRNN
jgi:hypothetical protein